MGTITFEVREGAEWATWQSGPEKDTTSDQVERLKGMADWETTFKPAYDAWKAEQETGGKKPKADAKDEAKTAAPAVGAKPKDDDDDDDPGRRTMAKGYRK